MSYPDTFNQARRIIRFRNVSDETMPAFGVGRLGRQSTATDWNEEDYAGERFGTNTAAQVGNYIHGPQKSSADDDLRTPNGRGKHVWRVHKPDVYSEFLQDPATHILNNHCAVPSLGYGWGTMDFPAQAAFEGVVCPNAATLDELWEYDIDLNSDQFCGFPRSLHRLTAGVGHAFTGHRYAGFQADSWYLHPGIGDAYTILDEDNAGPWTNDGSTEKRGQRMWVVPTMSRPAMGAEGTISGSGTVTLVTTDDLNLTGIFHASPRWYKDEEDPVKLLVGDTGWYRMILHGQLSAEPVGTGGASAVGLTIEMLHDAPEGFQDWEVGADFPDLSAGEVYSNYLCSVRYGFLKRGSHVWGRVSATDTTDYSFSGYLSIWREAFH